jgi:hypothetical protein
MPATATTTRATAPASPPRTRIPSGAAAHQPATSLCHCPTASERPLRSGSLVSRVSRVSGSLVPRAYHKRAKFPIIPLLLVSRHNGKSPLCVPLVFGVFVALLLKSFTYNVNILHFIWTQFLDKCIAIVSSLGLHINIIHYML